MSRSSDFPATWKRTTLGEACDIQIGGTPSRNHPHLWASEQIGHPWVAISDLGPKWIFKTAETITDDGVRYSNAKLVRPGTLLMSFKLTIGRIGIAGTELYTNEAIAAIIPYDTSVSTTWLYYLLPEVSKSSTTDQAIKGQTLNKEKLQLLPIWLPPPSEQHRIAAVLDALDETIATTEALVAKLKAMRQGLLHDLLTRGLDKHGELRDPELCPEQFTDGGLPRAWKIVSLRELADIGAGVTLGRNLSGEGTIELPYLRVANVQDGFLDLSDIKTVRVYEKDVSRYLLEDGDVLMNEGGDFDKLGRGAVWRGEIGRCLHQNHIFRVRTDRRKLLPEFLATLSMSAYGKKFFVMSSKQSTNLASINSTQLKSFPVLCPDIDEQQRILNALEIQDARLKSERLYLTKLQHMRQGLMDDLLTGRVRTDELRID